MGSVLREGGSRHLRFIKMPLKLGRKLHEYEVLNEQFGQSIGMIHWRGGWRQYVFEAHPEIDMSRGCMKEVIKFIDKIQKEWSNARRK